MPTEAKRLWLQALLREHLSPVLALVVGEQGWSITFPGSSARIRVDQTATDFRTDPRAPPCGHWDAAAEGFYPPMGLPLPTPGMHASTRKLWQPDVDGGTFGYDIPTLAWWMLSRVEEIGRADLDQHGRFPATASHAFRHGYLERPIVDEWLILLRQLLERVWPDLALHALRPSMRVSHDVDSPSRYAFSGPWQLLRSVVGDVVRRRDISGFVRGPRLWVASRIEVHGDDPWNTFDWIMDQSDEHGLTSAFYFICGRTDPAKDAAYDPEDPRIRALMRKIHSRGHEVGLHPSYGTYRTPELIAREAALFHRICAEEGIEQSTWGGRMHFLRWETPTTLYGWEQAGMTYDTTMSYADLPGFRCGTCYEYPAFDPIMERQLNLRIRPLIAMECTVMAPRYLGLGEGEVALAKFVQLKRACQALGGCFTLLWHNTYFEKPRHRDLYRSLLTA